MRRRGGGGHKRTDSTPTRTNPAAAAPVLGARTELPSSGAAPAAAGEQPARLLRAPIPRPLPPPWAHALGCRALAGWRRPQARERHTCVHQGRGRRPRLGRTPWAAERWRGGGGRRRGSGTPACTKAVAAAPASGARALLLSAGGAAAAAGEQPARLCAPRPRPPPPPPAHARSS
ncbi:hypothetical protein BU14_0057s0005 [Porphyra umbilicalis]|uniref:Uncharacterized protein n=1 Tax=Porphyra umbilicalis TaxID=2786 RepID=A0A1X6PH34_PORUM|nr:hypothetical protein BU14_0057s0005 [Porphyra umbilicalis]|eukprot:OSX80184.1 hypothetical protein BU14_0057s0005 [Porphyra umbilicalis]